MFFSSIKGINKLISNEMPNIYLKVTLEKNWRSQNFDFLSLDQLTQISLKFKTSCCNLKIRGGEQICLWRFNYFDFERNYEVLKL